MRKIYWFLWICCMAAIVSACSNDDDEPGMEIPGGNNGNNGTSGNLPGGDDIWPENVRRIKRIGLMTELGLPQDLLNIEYDGKIIKGYRVGYSSVVESVFKLEVLTSSVEVFTSEEDKGTSRIALNDGKVTSMACNVGDSYRSIHDSCYCTYENGYLKQMIIKSFYGPAGEVALNKEKQYGFTFTSGNFSESKCLYQYYEDEKKQTITYSFAKEIRNDANMDLLVLLKEYLISEDYPSDMLINNDISCLGMFGFFGERSKNLPTKIVCDSGSGDTQEWSISYEVDKEGYPIRIKCKEKNSDEVVVLGIYY